MFSSSSALGQYYLLLRQLSFNLHFCLFLVPSSNYSAAQTSLIKCPSSVPRIIYFFMVPYYIYTIQSKLLNRAYEVPSQQKGLTFHLDLISPLLVLACANLSFIYYSSHKPFFQGHFLHQGGRFRSPLSGFPQLSGSISTAAFTRLHAKYLFMCHPPHQTASSLGARTIVLLLHVFGTQKIPNKNILDSCEETWVQINFTQKKPYDKNTKKVEIQLKQIT